MGFKLLTVGSKSSSYISKFLSLVDDLPFITHHFDETHLGEVSPEVLLDTFSPSIVLIFDCFDAQPSDLTAPFFKKVQAYCQQQDVAVIFHSNYRVFDGDSLPTPIDELALFSVNSPSLGLDKELDRLFSGLSRGIVVRSGWIVDDPESGLLFNYVPKLIQGEGFVASDHNFGQPVYVKHVVDVFLAMTQQILAGAQNWGAFHLASSDSCSEAEFVDYLVRILKSDFSAKVEMTAVAGIGDDRRIMPLYSHLVGSRCMDEFGIQPQSWRSGFKTELGHYLLRNGV